MFQCRYVFHIFRHIISGWSLCIPKIVCKKSVQSQSAYYIKVAKPDREIHIWLVDDANLACNFT